MRKALPKLKKTVTSFLVEEDAKLMDKSASRVALSAAFMSSIVLLNIDSGNAAPWDHSDHKNHSNNLDLPPKDPRLVNLGESQSKITFSFEEELDVKVTQQYYQQPSTGYSYTNNGYQAYVFEVPHDQNSFSLAGSPQPFYSSSFYGTPLSQQFVETTKTVAIPVNNAFQSGYSDFSMTVDYKPDYNGVDSYSINVDVDMPQDGNGPVYVTIGEETKELQLPSYGNSDSVTITNQKTVDVAAKTPPKSISAIHANHYDHSNDGGW